MTDGPFKNATLSSRWKKYGKYLVNDAISVEERTIQAYHSMIGDIDLLTVSNILGAIKAYAENPQMDLDNISSIKMLFENCLRSPFTDALEKHLVANLRDRMPLDVSCDQALLSTVENWIGEAKNRLDEESIRARDVGDMGNKDYHKGIERNRETFASINADTLCDALTTGDKRAFKQANQKKTGIDEGPDE